MEMPEPAEWMQRPELDRDQPARLFSYAEAKQHWIRRRANPGHQAEAIDHLADELDGYMTSAFEGKLPEVTVVSRDVHYTRDIIRQGSRYIVETAPLPFNVNEDVADLEEHNLRGRLYGFHRGDNNDIRAFIDIGDEVRRQQGFIIMPLLSVGIEGSDIQIAELSANEHLASLGRDIVDGLNEYDHRMRELVQELLRLLNVEQETPAKKLHNISPVIAQIAQEADSPSKFVDVLLEFIKYKLRLDAPHDIQTSSHRVVITKPPTPSHKAKSGPTLFTGIVPQVGLGGESRNRWLGFFFINNDEAVQVPVQYITSIYKTQ